MHVSRLCAGKFKNDAKRKQKFWAAFITVTFVLLHYNVVYSDREGVGRRYVCTQGGGPSLCVCGGGGLSF